MLPVSPLHLLPVLYVYFAVVRLPLQSFDLVPGICLHLFLCLPLPDLLELVLGEEARLCDGLGLGDLLLGVEGNFRVINLAEKK